MKQTTDWIRVYGGYVCHFLKLQTEQERNDFEGIDFVSRHYNAVLKRFKPLGAIKYHNVSYGGGVLFNTDDLCALKVKINKILEEENQKEVIP